MAIIYTTPCSGTRTGTPGHGLLTNCSNTTLPTHLKSGQNIFPNRVTQGQSDIVEAILVATAEVNSAIVIAN